MYMITLENLIELKSKYERLLKENKELIKEQQTSFSGFIPKEEIKPSEIIFPKQKLELSYMDFVRRIKYNEAPDTIVQDIMDNSNPKQILEGILIYFFGEIETAKKLYANCNSEEREFVYGEIQLLQQQYTYYEKIYKQMSSQTQDFSSKSELKNLVYLRSTSNNPLIYSDFLSIPKEYYPSFLELFTSIEDGTLKNRKHLAYYSYYEVKGHKTRIVFSFAPNNSVVLLSAFLKKSDEYGKVIKSLLNPRIAAFNQQQKEIFKLCKNNDFLESQKETTDKIYTLLRGR